MTEPESEWQRMGFRHAVVPAVSGRWYVNEYVDDAGPWSIAECERPIAGPVERTRG